jgi:hypothetical protein
MKTTRILFALIFFAALTMGCDRATAPAPTAQQSNEAAIKTAIQSYLASRGTLNLEAMEMDVKQVNITGDRAEAQVEFRAKAGGGVMQMVYALERQGGVWTVKGSQSPGMQTGHPPVGGTAAPQPGELPPSHPPITSQPAKPAPAKPKKQ